MNRLMSVATDLLRQIRSETYCSTNTVSGIRAFSVSSIMARWSLSMTMMDSFQTNRQTTDVSWTHWTQHKDIGIDIPSLSNSLYLCFITHEPMRIDMVWFTMYGYVLLRVLPYGSWSGSHCDQEHAQYCSSFPEGHWALLQEAHSII